MSIFWLLFLHHIGDVAFQPSWLIQNKKKHPFAIYEHVFVWTGIVSIGLLALDLFAPWKVLFLFCGHSLIDWVRYHKVPHRERYEWIYPDQALHYMQISIVYFL